MVIGLISLTIEALHLAVRLVDLWRDRRTG